MPKQIKTRTVGKPAMRQAQRQTSAGYDSEATQSGRHTEFGLDIADEEEGVGGGNGGGHDG